jgi:hypothetical protein
VDHPQLCGVISDGSPLKCIEFLVAQCLGDMWTVARGSGSTHADLRVSSSRSEPILPPTRNDRGLILLVFLPRLVLVCSGQEPLELGEREWLEIARVDRLGLVPAKQVPREPCSSSTLQSRQDERDRAVGREVLWLWLGWNVDGR